MSSKTVACVTLRTQKNVSWGTPGGGVGCRETGPHLQCRRRNCLVAVVPRSFLRSLRFRGACQSFPRRLRANAPTGDGSLREQEAVCAKVTNQ